MTSEEELERELREQAERVIKRVLAEKKPTGENSLKDIEGMAIRAGDRFREQVLDYLAREESEVQEEPVCEECRRLGGDGRWRRMDLEPGRGSLS